MNLLLRHIIPNLILMISTVYIWHKFLDKKINLKQSKLYIVILVMFATSLLNYLFVNNFIRILLITIIFMFLFRILFKETFQKCIITPIFSQLLIMISETLYALLIIILNIDINLTIDSPILNIISNIIISVFLILIIRIKFFTKLYDKIINFTDKIKQSQLITLCLILMIISNILAMGIYYEIDYQYLLIFNCLLTLTIGIIIFNNFKTKNNYNKVADKYNVAINSLNDYEDMMNKYRIANHENKNLLLTIRAMILNKEKDIPKYIDSIVEDKYKDNEKLLLETSVIPTGGLRATIYSEILKIMNNDIKYSLNIDKNVNTVDLIELDEDTIIDICKIIGVFIDNSIDEVKKMKTRNIEISMFIEDNELNIKVSNNYKGVIEVDKIFNDGYTTKGNNHGYGLSLVKNIISNNSLLENKIEINKNIFSQILIIKTQNKKSH